MMPITLLFFIKKVPIRILSILLGTFYFSFRFYYVIILFVPLHFVLLEANLRIIFFHISYRRNIILQILGPCFMFTTIISCDSFKNHLTVFFTGSYQKNQKLAWTVLGKRIPSTQRMHNGIIQFLR